MSTGNDWGIITKADKRDRKRRRRMGVSGRSFQHQINGIENRAREIEQARRGSEVVKDWVTS